MSKGRYAAHQSGAFIRDLTVMLLLFIAAGTLAFGVIYWIQQRGADIGGDSSTLPVAASTPTTISPPTTGTTATTAPTTTAPPTTDTTTAAIRPNSEVRVLVLNAVGRPGIAGSLSETLAAAGYLVDIPGNYTGELERSKVWFKDGFTAEALEIAQYVPDADIELNPDTGAEADIVIVLGSTYEG